MSAGIGPLPIIIAAAFAVLFIVGWVKILTKAGYHGAWVLIGLVPLANLVMFLVFAFSEWPTVRERNRLRGGGSGYGGPGYGGPGYGGPGYAPPH